MSQQVRRSVERCDRQHRAGRGALRDRGVAHPAGPARHGQDLAADRPGLGRRDGERVGHPQHLPAAVLERFTQLQGQEPGELLGAGGDRGRGAFQYRRAGGRGQPRDRPGTLARVVERRGDVVGLGEPGPAHDPPHIRADPLGMGAFTQPFPGDQAFGFVDCVHVISIEIRLTVLMNRAVDFLTV